MNNSSIITCKPSKKHKIKEVWKYREVLYFLSWKDIIVRYKQTVLGSIWAILNPTFSMIIMTFVFGNLAKMPSNGVPYAILVFSAILPWNFFSMAFNGAANSLVSNSHLLKKIYFPRLTLPISSVITSFVDLLISFGVLIIIMVGFLFLPSIRIVFLPFFIILAFIIALGSGLLLATLNVKYRDIKYLIPFILQFGMYISPVGYSSNVIPENLRFVYSLNPMVGVIEGFRWCLIPTAELYLPSLIVSLVVGVVSLILGIKYFFKFENTFADLI
ncbi:ABC transporter permease [Neobacillus ginsengisoli]|uniref:Transport permease protein n=1 Tax=Neobacillus ginsengisoli TaxID=904295 RepID=A0ABT9XT85_9BACI|nr:ABC transporter permease [Neobacillus ginsengisoli]MDQ0198772.1 lipopolysaccharide transport system permease protein [Neobacillus ginsengisoli]